MTSVLSNLLSGRPHGADLPPPILSENQISGYVQF